jgi:hypothetical protein
VRQAGSAAQVLLNIVEALFVCYALDRDRQAVTNPKVHEVYSQVLMVDSCRLHCSDAAERFLAHVAAQLILNSCHLILPACTAVAADRRSLNFVPVSVQLPVGAVIEQPGEGGYAYGRPEAGQGQGMFTIARFAQTQLLVDLAHDPRPVLSLPEHVG